MASTLETLYTRLPVSGQHAACSIEGYRIKRSRYDREFHRLLAEYAGRSFASRDEIEALADSRMRSFLKHAVTAPCYATDLYLAAAADGSWSDLPIITKADVQPDVPSRTIDCAPEHVTFHHTSGSTGAGLRFPVTDRATKEQWAVWWRYRRAHGIQLDTWCGYFAGRSVVPVDSGSAPYWRYNVPGRQILFSGYHMSARTLEAYVAELNRRKPLWLHGYPSLLVLLASYLFEHSRSLDYQVRWITTGAENLHPQQRELVAAVFGVRPIEHYGMAEGVANISECPAGRLHVDVDFSCVEFVPATGGGWRVVGTNVTNPAFPLIRYDAGDIVDLDGSSCDCGRPGRTVRAIDGRREDYIVLADGSMLGRLDHIFKDQTNIREAQIYQPSFDRIVLRVVKGAAFQDEHERSLLDETRQRVGVRVHVSIEYFQSLPRTRSGKLRFVVSDLAAGRSNDRSA